MLLLFRTTTFNLNVAHCLSDTPVAFYAFQKCC
jgi:hypothetical protein